MSNNKQYMSYNFPTPLSKEDEINCFLNYNNGDMKAKEELILHNLRLVAYNVQRFNTTIESDDLFSVGTIALIKAIEKFDITKNVKFSTFATKCIENDIFGYLKKNNKHDECSLQDWLFKDEEGNSLLFEDSIEISFDIEDVLENKFYKYMIEQGLKKLNEMDRFIICSQFGFEEKEPITQKVIGNYLNLSQSYISRRQQIILEKLKKDFLK